MYVATAGIDDRHCPSPWKGLVVLREMDLVLRFCTEAWPSQQIDLTAVFKFGAYRKLLRISNGDNLLKP